MIAEQVNKINRSIAENLKQLKCLKCYKLFGIAEPFVRRHNKDKWIPAIIDNESEGSYVFADDDYQLGLYHRLLSKAYSVEKKRQYGSDIIETITTDMILVCWVFRRNLGKNGTADTFERIVYSSLSNEMLALQSNFDRKSVFANEFQGMEFFLPEDVLLFSMRYRFAYPTQRDCIKIENICKS